MKPVASHHCLSFIHERSAKRRRHDAPIFHVIFPLSLSLSLSIMLTVLSTLIFDIAIVFRYRFARIEDQILVDGVPYRKCWIAMIFLAHFGILIIPTEKLPRILPSTLSRIFYSYNTTIWKRYFYVFIFGEKPKFIERPIKLPRKCGVRFTTEKLHRGNCLLMEASLKYLFILSRLNSGATCKIDLEG